MRANVCSHTQEREAAQGDVGEWGLVTSCHTERGEEKLERRPGLDVT